MDTKARREAYKGWDRDALIATLVSRDEEIIGLRQRTLDDYVRDLIRTEVELKD